MSTKVPPPGYPEEEWLALPRQKRWQILRQAAGLCMSCGKDKVQPPSKRLCVNCQSKQRERMRQATAASRRNFSAGSYRTSPSLAAQDEEE